MESNSKTGSDLTPGEDGLWLSPKLGLPYEGVTQTFAFLAKRGGGKTYGAGVLVEEIAKFGAQQVVIDPTDSWWGIKSSATGKSNGYPFIIVGGNHGDLPLKEDSGQLLADFVVDRGHSMVICTRLLSKGKQARFVAEFFERIYERKGEADKKTPLQIVIDEADAYIPQSWSSTGTGAFLSRSVGAIDDLVRRGRSSGIGVTLISQRAAKINKDVLSQVECLVALQTASKHDRKALKEWVEVNADSGRLAEFEKAMAEFQQGEAWFWSPSWLRVMKKIKFRTKRTFDSSFTPKVGEAPPVPAKAAEIDLDAIRDELEDVVAEAEANDPRLLQARIRELEAREPVEDFDKVAMQRKIEELVEEANSRGDTIQELRQQLSATRRQFASFIRTVGGKVDDLKSVWDHMAEQAKVSGKLEEDVITSQPALKDMEGSGDVEFTLSVPAIAKGASASMAASEIGPVSKAAIIVARQSGKTAMKTAIAACKGHEFTGPQVKIMNSLAWWKSIGVDRPKAAQVAFIAGIKPTGGHFKNVIGPLSRLGFIERRDGLIILLPDGERVVQLPEGEKTLESYHEMIRGILKKGPVVKIFDAIACSKGLQVPTEVVHERSGIGEGGHFKNSIGPLSTLGLITRSNGQVIPTDLMFPPGLA